MFESKSKLSPSVKKMIKANGGQEMDKPAFPKVGYRQGDMNAPVTFFYRPNADTMTIERE